mgnify:CR=1 FL=1
MSLNRLIYEVEQRRDDLLAEERHKVFMKFVKDRLNASVRTYADELSESVQRLSNADIARTIRGLR